MNNTMRIAGALITALIMAGCTTVKQTADWRIVLYENEDFGGKQCVIEGKDVPALIDWEYNDTASSVIVSKGEWTMYQHDDYNGLAWEVSDKGGPNTDGKYPSFKEWNGKNESVSSVLRGSKK